MGDRQGWDIDPAGVKGVVTRVAGLVTDGHGGGDTLEHRVTAFGNHIVDAANAAASSPVGTALKEFAAHYGPILKNMAATTGNCVNGAVEATKYYINGDLEMAAAAERRASQAPPPG